MTRPTDVRDLSERLRANADANEAIADDRADECDRYITARLLREAADYVDAMHAATGRGRYALTKGAA